MSSLFSDHNALLILFSYAQRACSWGQDAFILNLIYFSYKSKNSLFLQLFVRLFAVMNTASWLNGTLQIHSVDNTQNKCHIVVVFKLSYCASRDDSTLMGTSHVATNALANPSHHPKPQLQRFTHFCTAMPQTSNYFALTPPKLPLPWTDP